jgi:hypothetical protein
VHNYEGYFKTIVANGIPFKVRLTDLAKRSVEFKEELDPREGLSAVEAVDHSLEEAEGEAEAEGDAEGDAEDEAEGEDADGEGEGDVASDKSGNSPNSKQSNDKAAVNEVNNFGS